MEKNIAVIMGDGIGPEVTGQSLRILDAVAQRFGHAFHYAHGLMGAVAIDATGDPLPQEIALFEKFMQVFGFDEKEFEPYFHSIAVKNNRALFGH